jgi:UDP-N-acetylmuramoylalanine--D-glutamate ligase
MPDNDLRQRRFSIIGAARSGVAVARLLRSRGAEVLVSEAASREAMQETAATLEREQIPAEFGGHSARVLEADTLVVSPGVPGDAPVVQRAQAAGLEVVSEIEVAGWFCRAPIVGVTGTNGKTTTTTLIGRMLDDARHPAVVGGNIGTAFSEVVGRTVEGGSAVLEISSFQLDHIRTFRAAVAVLLNITPDHLDRYNHSFERYAAAKGRIFERQQPGDIAIYNCDDEAARATAERSIPAGVRRMVFSAQGPVEEGAFVEREHLMTVLEGRVTEVLPVREISIPGLHNLYNAMAAVLAVKARGIATASARASLRNFRGVEHRLEFVREMRGVRFVNDSKATNVDSVWYALQSFDRPLVLLLGGRDKGNDYRRLTDLVRRHVHAIVAIGESAEKVEQAFRETVPVRRAETMPLAIQAAVALARPGDTVLLSPACASFDWFQNYEHRGRVFKQLVMDLP